MMQAYHLRVEVVFNCQMPVVSDRSRGSEIAGKWVNGYFQLFGCTAATFGDVEEIIIKYIKEDPFFSGCNDWIDEIAVDEVEKMYPNEVGKFMDENYGSVVLLQDPFEEGIWYKSGHGFYWDDEPEQKKCRGVVDSIITKLKHLLPGLRE